MENQEEKKACCEGKANCEHGMPGCCGNWKKCRMIKIIFGIIVLIIIFHLGVQWGEMKGELRGSSRFEREGMMNFGYNGFENKIQGNQQKTTGQVTVEVNKDIVAPTVAPIAPKQ